MSDLKPDAPHGSKLRYNRGCKCDDCTRAAARYEQERQLDILAGRPRRVPIIGSQRRLQALVRLGYDWKTLGRELGVTDTMVHQWAESRAYMYRDTAARVAAVYDRLSMVLPPQETTAQKNTTARARSRAERKGWPPPLAWDDDIDDPAAKPYRPNAKNEGLREADGASTVDRVLGGDWRLHATKADRVEIVARWRAAGRSLNDLARLTGWKPERYYTPACREVAS